MEPRYRTYASYLRERYGGLARRVAVDPGLGCPHRATGGCAFCELSSPPEPLEEQIRRRLTTPPRRAGTLLLYLQGGTGTNAAPDVLREVYDRALAMADFRELIVATRPDCVDIERARLLGGYVTPRRDVWVELGLQSSDDATLRAIHRGHDAQSFGTARSLLARWGIRVAVHVIHGLPGEGREGFLRTIRWVAAQEPEGIKIHNLHVKRGTALARSFLRGELTVPGPETHLEAVAEALELLPGRTIVMRLLTDTDPGRLLAPRRYLEKNRFLRELDRLMDRRDLRQGARYG